VQRGQPLVHVHARATTDLQPIEKRLSAALKWADDPFEAQPVILGRQGADS
jgi:hypothetical protein